MTEKHGFKVSYESDGDHFVVRVRGDFTCNGVPAEFSRAGDLRALNAPELFKVQYKNRTE
jgi:hypothetical protein